MKDPKLNVLQQNVLYMYKRTCKRFPNIMFMIMSKPDHFSIRENIRETYGRNNGTNHYVFNQIEEVKNLSHCFMFLIGYTTEDDINKKVDDEASSKGDIIRVPTLDGYRKTANKIVMGMYLMYNLNIDFVYLVKVDDDVLIRTNLLVPHLVSLPPTAKFLGHLSSNKPVIRDPNNSWYVPKDAYPNDTYPPYLIGPIYAIRRDIIPQLVNMHYKMKFIPMEDVHISMLVIRSGYQPADDSKMRFCYDWVTCKKANSYTLNIGKDIKQRIEIEKEFKNDFPIKLE